MNTDTATSDDRPYLVVTGSSAGGIDALIALVAALPADFPAPIVIAQHTAPTHVSRLGEILKTRTALGVCIIEEREVLRPGTLYLVGADRDIEIADESATAILIARKGPKPSIDRLFQTGAETHGERLIALIFSGMGSDGLAGARVVKEYGGSVIVQEPGSAAFPAMPLAIPPTLVDLWALPEKMPEALLRLVSGSYVANAPTERETLQTLLTRVRETSGIDFSQYKLPTIERRLGRLMVAAGASSIDEYVQHLEQHPADYQRLVNAFLIKVTEFFRDAPLFDALRSKVLPQLIRDAHRNGNELRIWSAGTSTGEEAYSLAILCAEALRDEKEQCSVRIFATDLDANAIAFARHGVFTEDALRHVPNNWIERYFVRVGETYEVGKRIRGMTVFGQHDLGQRAPFPRIDLCLCRNVLIYFTRELQTRALQLFAFSLRRNGLLVLGKAESPGTMSAYFRTLDANLKIYERDGEQMSVPPVRMTNGSLVSTRPSPSDPRSVDDGGVLVAAQSRRNSSELFGTILGGSQLGIVAVDRRYDILAMNSAARTLLEIHGVGVGEDLIHLIHTIDAQPLRVLIDEAFRHESPSAIELTVGTATGGPPRFLQLLVRRENSGETYGEVVGVFIVDVSEGEMRRLEVARLAQEQKTRIDELSTRSTEISGRHRVLLQANDELIVANVELRNMNEQLLVNAEEAASSSEEIETLNEEMQATNEELETLNEELQATVEELNTTNDELEARGGDLERIAREREAELIRVDAERAALGLAMERAAGPFVLLSDDRIVYGSNGVVADVVAREAAGWWRADEITFDDTSYRLKSHTVEGSPITVVVFQKM